MPKIFYRSGVPFCILEQSEENEPLEIWDGSTVFLSKYLPYPDSVTDVLGSYDENNSQQQKIGLASLHEDKYVSVVGPNSLWPIGPLTLDNVYEIFWRMSKLQLTLEGKLSFNASKADTATINLANDIEHTETSIHKAQVNVENNSRKETDFCIDVHNFGYASLSYSKKVRSEDDQFFNETIVDPNTSEEKFISYNENYISCAPYYSQAGEFDSSLIARWGSVLGMPNPGYIPYPKEMFGFTSIPSAWSYIAAKDKDGAFWLQAPVLSYLAIGAKGSSTGNAYATNFVSINHTPVIVNLNRYKKYLGSAVTPDGLQTFSYIKGQTRPLFTPLELELSNKQIIKTSVLMLKALVGITDNSDSPFADIQGLDSLKIKLKITEWLTFDDYIDKNTGLIKQPN